jgi:hypothetical protein
MSITCSTHGEKRTAYRILVGKPEGKGPLGRHRREDNVEVNLKRNRSEWYRLNLSGAG